MAPRSKKSDSPPLFSRLLRRLYRPKWLCWLAVLAVLAAFSPRIIRSLPDVSQRDAYRMRTAAIRITDRPDWVPDDLIEQVIEEAELPAELSLLEPGLTSRIAEAFLQNAWVTGVRVHTKLPAGLVVELKYRRPVGMVEVPTGLYPIDAEGVLLPPADFTILDAAEYPLIRNISTLPQGAAGRPWGDAAVEAVAKLAAVLHPHWRDFGLEAIYVPSLGPDDDAADSGVFELHTAGGSRIVWGRAPDSGHPGELTPAQKIGRLQEYVERFGGFDAPHGPYEIDIRHWQEISRRQIATQESNSPR